MTVVHKALKHFLWSLLFGVSASVTFADGMAPEYQSMCQDCHGTTTTPGIAPSLFATALSEAEFRDIVRGGRRAMPNFPSEAISDNRLRALYQGLKTAVANDGPADSTPQEPSGNRTRRPTTLPGLRGTAVDAETARRLATTHRSPADLYRQQCERCHRDLNGPLPGSPLDQRYFIPELRFMSMNQSAFIRLVQQGAGPMPAFPDLTEAQLTELYRWIGKFEPATPNQACRADNIQQTHRRWGRELYLAHCARCHGESGQGSFGSSARIDTPAFNLPVPLGVIWQKANAGHSIAPALPFLSHSDKRQIAVYLREMKGWERYSREDTPATFRQLNGEDCQRQLCTRYAHAADEKVRANSNPGLQPNAGSLECEQYQRKNRRKGPAGPGSIYPDCWAQQEVDQFEAFCEAYTPGISSRYPKPPEVQAVTTAQVQANAQLRPVWSNETASLTCRFHDSMGVHIATPNADDRPNWQIRLYTTLHDRAEGEGCWWSSPQQTLGEGNPLPDDNRRDRITVFVRLPENGTVPARKYWSGKLGVEDLDQPDHSRPANTLAFYQALRVMHAKSGEFTLTVYRNVEHDRTRKPRACSACGNSEFSNEKWSTDK
ncbi:c-type cytochrome [Permianibacter aggregans]|uniref:Cbb3-type cytochrome c oxidase subunit III n=1 Tax=Permianibacter aggregans TaxID=1510150 RepID=A0A4R6UQB7_9GAMM|nr:c-type cytochrome [Permianibacter aggregans]QGX40056.1 hypothetical protein E2H98_10410 [Permianibacter aggregans]TDQ49132.1 cbb3-type cytochrome c oxidase subunit III [Permianibacter aggregans]